MGERDYAVVIGVGRYDGDLARLDSPVENAKRVAAWLVEHAGLPTDNVKLVLSKEEGRYTPDRDEVDAAFGYLVTEASRAGGRRLYVYYSGHGTARKLHGVFLQMANAAFTGRALDTEEYQEHLGGWPGFREELFLYDCCRTDDNRGGGLGPGFKLPRTPAGAPRPVQIVGYGASRDQEAREFPDETGEKRSLFTRALLEGLEGRAARPDDDGGWIVTTRSLEAYARRRVEQLIKPHVVPPQTPTFDTFGADSFVLAKHGQPMRVPVKVKAPASQKSVEARNKEWGEVNTELLEDGEATLLVVPGLYTLTTDGGCAPRGSALSALGFGVEEVELVE